VYERLRARILVAQQSTACVSMIILAFVWQYNVHMFSSAISLPLYIMFFALAAVSSTSTVAYLPHMTKYVPKLMSPFFVGIGAGALVPSLLALAQGRRAHTCVFMHTGTGTTTCVVDNKTNTSQSRNTEPSFSVEVYFVLMSVWQLLSLIAFVYLAWCAKNVRIPRARRQKVKRCGHYASNKNQMYRHCPQWTWATRSTPSLCHFNST
jgi:hypothetical protein